MTRQLLFAITLIGTATLLSATAEAVTALQCEDRNTNCMGGCADRTGGARRPRRPSEQMYADLRQAGDQMHNSLTMTIADAWC